MNKILLIGNSGTKRHGDDGQTIKVRLYLKKIKDENFDVDFVDLESFTSKPFSTLRKIKNGIKTCDRVVLLTAKRGCKVLIPFINRLNKKYKKPFVLPLIGTSVLHYSLDKLNDKEKNKFLLDNDYSLGIKNERIASQLTKIDYILPETDSLVKIFREFYGLNNVYKLNNFRDCTLDEVYMKENHEEIRIAFLSRLTTIKGIFDALDVVKNLAKDNKLKFDIYGTKTLSKQENQIFNSYIDNKNIIYKGSISNEMVCEILAKYDLLIFPTRYYGEGTPGVIAESLISGTPVLTTDFPQAHLLLRDGFDSVFCKMFDKEDLKTKLLYIIKDKNLLLRLQKNAIQSGKKFTYKYERNKFLEYVCGKKEE